MSATNNRRLHKLEMSLTPKQAAILWMTEAHRFPSLYEYMVWLRDKPKSAAPLYRLHDQMEAAVTDSMKGKPRDEVERAIRHAYRDAAFLFYLQSQVNSDVYEDYKAQKFHGALLAEQLRGILHQSMISDDIMLIRCLLGVNTAYPLDVDTAAAVDAASLYAVISWEDLEESEVIAEWVTDHFRRQGKTELPPGAYRSDSDDPNEEILALFDDADAYDAFVAEKDYSYGFADVHDIEHETVYDAVTRAMKGLVKSGEIESGACVHLEQVPVAVLTAVPLVDNVWLDRYVAELAEWYALLEHKGFERCGADDDHPMAWDYISPPAAGEGKSQEPHAVQVNAIGKAARANLAKFKGKTKTIDGRVYLHFDDYRRWKGRKVKGRLAVTEGLLISSWNAWVDANGENGAAELAGVQVSKLTPWFHEYDYVVHGDRDRATAMQQKRDKIIARLREYAVSVTADTVSSMPFESQSYKDKIIAWSDRARSFAAELYLTHAAIAQIGQRYFDGHAVLFDDRQQELDRLIQGFEDIIDLHNNTLAPLLPRQRIDLSGIRRAIQPHVAAKALYFVDRARAETLCQFDEHDAAVATIAPYAYGDKSEHVEICLDDRTSSPGNNAV